MPIDNNSAETVYGDVSDRFTAALKGANINMKSSSKSMMMLARAYKIYSNPQSYTQRDVLLNNAQVEKEDVENMIGFFEKNAVELNGRKLDEAQAEKANQIRSFGKQFLSTVNNVKMSDLPTYSDRQVEAIRQNHSNYNSAFGNYVGDTNRIGGNTRMEDSKLNAGYESFKQFTKPVGRSADEIYKISDHAAINSYKKALANNTMGEVSTIATRDAMNSLGNNLKGMDSVMLNALETEKITIDGVYDFVQSGKVPENLQGDFQKAYNAGYNNFTQQNKSDIEKGKFLAPPPMQMDRKGVPPFENVTSLIANDAMASLKAQRPEMNESQLQNYRNIVQMQLENNLMAGGYLDKCKQQPQGAVEQGIKDFTSGKDKTFPLGFDAEMVNKSVTAAANAMNKIYPEQRINPADLTLVNERQTFLSDSKYKNQIKAVEGVDKDRPAPTEHEFVNGVQMVDKPPQEDLIKNLNFKKPNMTNMTAAANAFDKFMKDNPQFEQCMENPVIRDSCKTTTPAYKDKKGKTVPAKEMTGDVTKLFYIDGKPVEKYVSGQVKDFKTCSPAEKQLYCKMAVMNAMATGKAVDVKSYVERGDRTCGVKITNLAYGEKGKNSLDDKKYHQQATKRANSILKSDKKADDKLVASVNENIEKFNKTAYKNFPGVGKNPVKASRSKVMSDSLHLGDEHTRAVSKDTRTMNKPKVKDNTKWL